MSEQRLIDAVGLQEEIESHVVLVTGLRAGKGVLNEFMGQYRDSVLRVIDEQPTIDPETLPIVRELREKLSRYEKAEQEGRHPGDCVWVVERDEFENPCDVSGFVFVAEILKWVIVSPFFNGSSDIGRIMLDLEFETADEYSCSSLAVYRACDCYSSKEEAEAALEERETE